MGGLTDFDINTHAKTLHWLADYWGGNVDAAFHWDGFHSRLIGPGFAETYNVLDGSFSDFRGWHSPRFAFGRLRRSWAPSRWSNHLINCKLPSDSVVWSKSDGRVLFVASASRKRILKCGYGDWFGDELTAEIEAWNRINGTPMRENVPAILEYGEGEDKTSWTISELVPHEEPLFFSNHKNRFAILLKTQLLSAMQGYYEETSFEILTRKQWWSRLTSFGESRPANDQLHQLISRVDKVISTDCDVDFKMPLSIPHGDLKVENVRRSHGKWWLIDWTARNQMGVIFDVFSDIFYDYYLAAEARDSKAFWDWLIGDIDESKIPKRVRDRALIWSEWQKSWLGLDVSLRVTRIQLLLMCVDFFEVNRVQRGVSDPRLFRLLQLSP